MSVIASAKVPIYEVQSNLTKLERFQLRLPVCFALDMDCQHGSASLSLASDFLEYAVLHGFKTAFSCGNERKWKPRTIRLSTLEIESRIHIRPGGVEYAFRRRLQLMATPQTSADVGGAPVSPVRLNRTPTRRRAALLLPLMKSPVGLGRDCASLSSAIESPLPFEQPAYSLVA